mmetsp:Transcript_359/g.340  ORF Transcript_359/g.340 Transcript_359/m.340 type:complete len:118 (-) Transcript_359:208-561(-)
MELFLKQKLLFRSALKAQKYFNENNDEHNNNNNSNQQQQNGLSKSAAREAIRYAQHLGLLGMGPNTDHYDIRKNGGGNGANQDFTYPELLDLTWPPEGRLLERDCTCDMWDRIRYRY